MNCVSIFPTQCHTAGRWQVNQNVGAHINGLVFFYFLLCVCVCWRARFFYSICTFSRKIITNIPYFIAQRRLLRLMAGIWQQFVWPMFQFEIVFSVCLFIVFLLLLPSFCSFFLFLFHDAVCEALYHLFYPIWFTSTFFLLIELSDVFVCVRCAMHDVLIWLMAYSLYVHNPNSQNTSYCSLIRWIFSTIRCRWCVCMSVRISFVSI